jgi:hypothetical protein
VREEFLQYRRIQNGSQFIQGAWTPASTKKVKRTKKERRALKAARKAAGPLVRQLQPATRSQFGVELQPYDIEKLIVQGGALRLNPNTGVRYDKASGELVKAPLPS